MIDIFVNSRIFDILGILSYMSWFFGDFKFVRVVNNITHQKCNVNGHNKKMHVVVYIHVDIVET